jgi:hypothetical protein
MGYSWVGGRGTPFNVCYEPMCEEETRGGSDAGSGRSSCCGDMGFNAWKCLNGTIMPVMHF